MPPHPVPFTSPFSTSLSLPFSIYLHAHTYPPWHTYKKKKTGGRQDAEMIGAGRCNRNLSSAPARMPSFQLEPPGTGPHALPSKAPSLHLCHLVWFSMMPRKETANRKKKKGERHHRPSSSQSSHLLWTAWSLSSPAYVKGCRYSVRQVAHRLGRTPRARPCSSEEPAHPSPCTPGPRASSSAIMADAPVTAPPLTTLASHAAHLQPAAPAEAVPIADDSGEDNDVVPLSDPVALPPALGLPAAADLRMLAPEHQRALLQRDPSRIAFVTHVAEAVEGIGQPLLLVVRDGPTNVEVAGLPAIWVAHPCVFRPRQVLSPTAADKFLPSSAPPHFPSPPVPFLPATLGEGHTMSPPPTRSTPDLFSCAPQPRTPAVLSCFGLWWSVVSGRLGDAALQSLAGAAPEFLWAPLRSVYDAFATLAAGPTISAAEDVFVDEVLTVHRWQDAVVPLRRALAKNPFSFRRIINATIWPPRPTGQECPVSTLWLCPCPFRFSGSPNSPPCPCCLLLPPRCHPHPLVTGQCRGLPGASYVHDLGPPVVRPRRAVVGRPPGGWLHPPLSSSPGCPGGQHPAAPPGHPTSAPPSCRSCYCCSAHSSPSVRCQTSRPVDPQACSGIHSPSLSSTCLGTAVWAPSLTPFFRLLTLPSSHPRFELPPYIGREPPPVDPRSLPPLSSLGAGVWACHHLAQPPPLPRLHRRLLRPIRRLPLPYLTYSVLAHDRSGPHSFYASVAYPPTDRERKKKASYLPLLAFPPSCGRACPPPPTLPDGGPGGVSTCTVPPAPRPSSTACHHFGSWPTSFSSAPSLRRCSTRRSPWGGREGCSAGTGSPLRPRLRGPLVSTIGRGLVGGPRNATPTHCMQPHQE